MFARIAGLILGSVLFWTSMRSLQSHAETRLRNSRIIAVPSWLSFLCGRPLPDNKVYLPAMLLQLGSLVAGLVWFPVVFLGLSEQMLMYLGGGMFAISLVAFAVAQVESVLANRRTK
jgi:hypothetical protein